MTRRKNALWLFILIGISLIMTGAKVDAKPSPIKVSVDPLAVLNTALVPGKNFTIGITVDYIKEMWLYQIQMSFNASIIQGVKVENGPFLENAGGTKEIDVLVGQGFDNEKGELSLFGAAFKGLDITATGSSTDHGPLAYVTFKVVGIGYSPIALGIPRLEELGMETGLMNKTGGWQFDGEWAHGWRPRLPTDPPWYPEKVPNPEFLGNGCFDNRPPIYVDPSEVKAVLPGKNFTINVNVANMTDLYSWEFSMSWNATLLNATSVTEGEFLKRQGATSFGPTEIDNEEGNLSVSGSVSPGGTGVSGSGTLANVTFLVKEEGKCNLTLYNTILRDSADIQIYIRSADGLFDNMRFHNTVVSSVTPYPTRVKAGSGQPIFINVTVMNVGSFPETGINVTAYYEENEIGTETNVSLAAGASITLTFEWDTTGVERGKYIIKANATLVEDEIETADNTFVYGFATIFDRDVAVTSVTTSVINVFSGHNVTIDVEVMNMGTEIETFDVTVYYDGTPISPISTQTVTDLGHRENKTLAFTWDTTDVELGEYTIRANATVVEDETETANNAGTSLKKVTVMATEEEPFPIELVILAAVVVAIVGAAALFFWRRRRPSAP